jgi:hypothetical protein
MRTPSLLRAVLRQVRLPEVTADDRPVEEEAFQERPTQGAGVSKNWDDSAGAMDLMT